MPNTESSTKADLLYQLKYAREWRDDSAGVLERLLLEAFQSGLLTDAEIAVATDYSSATVSRRKAEFRAEGVLG